MSKKPKFADIANLDEDRRIDVIGQAAMMAPGKTVAFVTDDQPASKADRYVRKLLTKFPALEVLARTAGPVAGTVSVRVRVKAAKTSNHGSENG